MKFDLFKRLFSSKPLAIPTIETTEVKPLEVSQSKPADTKITLEAAGKESEFPLRIFTIVGKMGYGKTFLANGLAEYYKNNSIPIVYVKSLDELDVTDSVIVIDDLKEDLTEKILSKIVEDFRTARHKRQIIILTHQLLERIPSELLKLSEKIVLFQSNFNVDVVTSKANILVPKADKYVFQQKVMELDLYQYLIVKHGKLFGVFPNTDINHIVGDSNGKEISLIGKPNNGNKTQTNNKMIQYNGAYVNKSDVKLSIVIIEIVKAHPEWKYSKIAQELGTTTAYVKNAVRRAKRKGLIN